MQAVPPFSATPALVVAVIEVAEIPKPVVTVELAITMEITRLIAMKVAGPVVVVALRSRRTGKRDRQARGSYPDQGGPARHHVSPTAGASLLWHPAALVDADQQRAAGGVSVYAGHRPGATLRC